ncbi:zinc finger bed domain-containing protein 1-like protein [Lasius niger]|uniref:Zinc finger bed domain-containing protein 1-like protein n=1 Tax=Lasius niger TaxID=67767 RepID=A0A0J7MY03_LASNI|nr:zinc finger bed domain-containing protein 1-like protein [Lasius niger]
MNMTHAFSADGNVDDPSNSSNSGTVEPPRKKRKRNETTQDFCSSDRQESITQAIAKFISTSILPLSIVSLEGFQNFMKVLEPTYKVPCEQTIRSRLQVLYNTTRSIIEKKLAVTSSISLTTDEWCSRAKDRYISVEVQTLDNDCCLQHFNLCTEALEERPTAINIADSLNSVMIDWNLIGKVQAVVHDSARAMELAGNLIETEDSISCAAHLIQLVVKDCMTAVPQYEAITKKGARIVSHFHHSDLAVGALSKRQKQLEMKNERLVQSCPTRWDSIFYMCESLLRNRSAIELVLGDRQITTVAISKNLEISEEDWSIMESMVKVLRPFQVATTVLCNENMVTISLVRPIIHGLKTKHMIESSEDDNYIKLFKSEAISSLNKRFNKSANLTSEQISCFLDPRYKSLSHEDEFTRKKVNFCEERSYRKSF